MTSREAFEAWCRAEGVDTTLWLKDQQQCGYANARTTDYWVGWQAAIQHARDVAVKACEEISEREHRDFKGRNPDAPPSKRGNLYVEGLSDGADLAADAIKEALK